MSKTTDTTIRARRTYMAAGSPPSKVRTIRPATDVGDGWWLVKEIDTDFRFVTHAQHLTLVGGAR